MDGFVFGHVRDEEVKEREGIQMSACVCIHTSCTSDPDSEPKPDHYLALSQDSDC